jgi:hypothetical protein
MLWERAGTENRGNARRYVDPRRCEVRGRTPMEGIVGEPQPGPTSHRDLSDYPAVMTLDDYCAYYGISKATGRRWIAEGRATRVPNHRHIKILRESVRLYEERLLREPRG